MYFNARAFSFCFSFFLTAPLPFFLSPALFPFLSLSLSLFPCLSLSLSNCQALRYKNVDFGTKRWKKFYLIIHTSELLCFYKFSSVLNVIKIKVLNFYYMNARYCFMDGLPFSTRNRSSRLD